jgi:hypothetical protein
MIITSQKFQPLIRVIQPELNTYALRELIENFIRDNSSSSYVKGGIQPVMQVTGFAREHAWNLTEYLNRSDEFFNRFEFKEGFFLDHQIEHFWTQAANVLIDVCLKQFRNFPQLSDNPFVDVANYTYLICDNPHDQLYQLYCETVE